MVNVGSNLGDGMTIENSPVGEGESRGRLVLGVASGDRPIDPPCRPLRTRFE